MNKKISKKNLSMLLSVACICLCVILVAAVLLPLYQVTIDKHILGDGIDLSDYDPSEAKVIAQEIEAEGIVLLKNENIFPLSDTAVTLWGVGSAHMAYTGYGSGGGDATNAVRLKTALNDEGISVYEDLYSFYESKGTTGNTGTFGSVGVDTASTEVSHTVIAESILEGAKDYSDTAIYVIARVGAENGTLNASDLALSEYEEATLDYIVENYSKVILILNTANQFEFGFVEGVGVSRNSGENYSKYVDKINGAIWVGAPGEVGTISIAKVLTGEINPSGRLTDTYAYSVESSPAGQNYFSQTYTDNKSIVYTNYIEGIYVGYKWYETAAYEGAIDYDDYTGSASRYTDGTIPMGVMYPFGFGLSYTTFSWEIVSAGTTANGTQFDSGDKNDAITVNVKVTNTGTVAGKDVVQCYFTAPYTNGGIEKSYVTLAGFAKTSLLEPNASETVTITFDLYDMSSYDFEDSNDNGIEGYELEAGDYYVRIMKNAHDWVNVTNASPLCLKYTVTENVHFSESLSTGATIENQFEDLDGEIEFLSRASHFANATVVKQVDHVTTDYTDQAGNTGYVRQTALLTDGVNADEVYDYEQYVDYEVDLGNNIIMFDEMIGVDYDDELWDTFISQLSKAEMAELIAYGNYGTVAIDRLGVPKTLMADGPSSVKSTYANGASCVLQPSEVVVAATWNQELAYRQGVSFGSDAAVTGVSGWYAPSVNIHRAPFNGRNYEYYSEDAVLSGIMATQVTLGAQSCGINVTLKHLLLYCDAASTGWKWCTEQAVREIYLKPFQMGIEDGGAKMLMTSNSFNGLWVGCSRELLTNVIRNEFGFEGLVVSDAATSLFWVQQGIRAGNDLWLSFDNSRRVTLVREKNIDALQDCSKHILYTLSTSSVAMGTEISSATWSPSMVGLIIIELVCLTGLALCTLSAVKMIKAAKQVGFEDDYKGSLAFAIALGISMLTFVVALAFFIVCLVSFNLFAELHNPIMYTALIVMIVSVIVWFLSFFSKQWLALFHKKEK